MKKNISLNDLLIEELTDLLNAESQLVEALPKIAQASQSLILKTTLEDYLEITGEHFFQLQDIFSDIGQSPQGVTCKAMKGFIEQGAGVISDAEQGHARDAAIISIMQRMEQYEIIGYRTASEHAFDLGHTRAVTLLNKTLDEKRAMKLLLNEVAQNIINVQVMNPKGPDRHKDQQQEFPLKNKTGGFHASKTRFKRGGVRKKFKNSDVIRFISEGNPNIQEPS